jgi:type II secretory pathway component PulK
MSRGVVATPNKRGGSALLVVLIMLGIIAVLAAAVARSVSGAALELSTARATAENETDLRAGIELGAAAILKLGEDMRSADASANLRGRRISVRITNERARIDLNKAKADMLAGLLKAEGFDDNEAASLAENVIEWRGGADSHKQLTAPLADAHFSAPLQSINLGSSNGFADKKPTPQVPTLRFFIHPIQLASVPGFSKALVKRLFSALTVANGSEQVNPFIASPKVLRALPGASSDSVESFLDNRDANLSHDMAIQILRADKQVLSEEPASGWRLEITTTPRSGLARHGEAIIAGVKGDGDEPYHVLYVLDDTDRYAR